MSAVIEFPVERIVGAVKDESDTPAEIIIFPGVRVERPNARFKKRLTPSKPRSAR
ncbi:MAG TPA: hypothetical protein VMZ01_08215 [Aestuariivirga sp.]|nr:hypothetical protein [Aestuariivirga sp.]